MYRLLLVSLVSFTLFTSCDQQTGSDAAAADTTDSLSGWYGEQFEIAEVIPASQLDGISTDSLPNEVVIEAEILECCRKKGCWMTIDMGEGKSMRVTFKDYGFFVPLNADGRVATLKGAASVDTVDVETLRHFAEDAGKSKEEIEAITEPEYELTFEATGVLIK
jgi:hypothetical protein